MKRLQHQPVFRFLADMRLAAVILGLFAVAAATGTWIEARYANLGSIETGQAAVYDLVYDAPWFNGLLILLFVNLVVNLAKRLLNGRQSVGYLLVHVGMIVILAGAGITRWFGYEGVMRIREGQTSDQTASKAVYAVAATDSDEASLPVRLYRPGVQEHSKSIDLDGETLTLGVSEYWPRFERRLEEGAGGVAGVELATGGRNDADVHILYQGDDALIGGVAVRVHAAGLPDTTGYSGDTVDFTRQEESVVMRASFPIVLQSARGAAGSQAVPAFAVVPVAAGDLIRGGADFRFVVNDVAASLVVGGVASADPDAPAAARIYLEKDGERVESVCVQGEDARTVTLAGRAYRLSFGPVFVRLPYTIHLEDFVLETYPGSENPANYESHVRLNDPDRGIEDRPVRIWMNHPLNHRGTKHFQSSYDADRLGTVLAINRDPGKVTTYVGYTLISLGFLIVLLRIVAKRVSALRAMAKAAALVVLGVAAVPAGAAATPAPPELALSAGNLESAARLIVQDYRGRMKPLDTLARETAIKITKQTRFEERDPVEVFLDFAVHPEAWYRRPAIHVKDPGVQDLLGVERSVNHVPLSSLLMDNGYRLADVVGEAHRTPSNRRDRTQQKLVVFDERVHLLFGVLQGNSLRIFPIPDDPGNAWQTIEKVLEALPVDDPRRGEFQVAAGTLFSGLLGNDDDLTAEGLSLVHELQREYGSAVIPSHARIDAELNLNRTRPFVLAIAPYLLGFVLLIAAFFVGLLTGRGGIWSWRNPLYLAGMLAFLTGFGVHLGGYVLRWIASARGPLSNGHESLLWVALTVALAGIIFELISRTAAVGALSSLLTAVVLSVSSLGTFDPSIGPLMPVLASYWLNIHVTVITASYGFLGLSCLLGLLTLVLLMINRRRRTPAAVRAVVLLDELNVDVMIAGIGLLAVGTLLGGVWANESWGRYWGWDPKETWALVSILLYAMILHFRWIPRLANPFVQAAGSFLAVWSIVMTYFGVNYLLMGMHSYAAGDKVAIPLWATISVSVSLVFTAAAYRAWSGQRSAWRRESAPAAEVAR